MADYTAIDDPSAYFQTTLYTGNGSADHAITNTGNSDLQPDMVWIKNRDATDSNVVVDSVRGVGTVLVTDSAAAESTDADTVDAFQSDGFRVDADVKVNTNAEKYVAWQWKGGTTASGTTGGSGTGKPYAYSASPASGFSVVTFTGNATAGHLIPHGMGKVPKMIHIKSRADDNGWTSGVSVAGGFNDHGYLYLENAFGTDANQFGGTHTTTNIRLGTGTGTNGNNGTRVAYCFADVQGYQKIGEYTGNGNADGTFIYLGFKPAWFMLKKTSAADPWLIYDNKRSPINQVQANLQANTSNVEVTNTVYLDFLSNGVKLRNTDNDGNLSGGTFIYLAIAENPLVTSTGVPATAR
jgi:hypothetical protein